MPMFAWLSIRIFHLHHLIGLVHILDCSGENSTMEKIVIIGSPGAGKSTFARKLGSILKIKVVHLDRVFWQPGWKEKPKILRDRYPRKNRSREAVDY